MDVVYGIRRIYSIAREGVRGREGLAIAKGPRAGGFMLELLGGLGAVLGCLGRSWGGLGAVLGGIIRDY